jgi:hypothetical protein
VTKPLVILVAVVVLIVLLLPNHPVIATWVLCGLSAAAQVVYSGWQSYKWKRSDWIQQQAEQAGGCQQRHYDGRFNGRVG